MDRPFDASAPLDLLAALPSVLADQLADALYRSSAPTAVRRAVEELAAAHPAHAVTLRRAAEDLLAAGDPSASTRIGPFRLVSLLGRGGYGEVYLAEQDAPVARRVALKVLKRGMDSHAILQRFAREQDAVARMNHDAIARIHDAGMTIGGQPWFAMELVEGLPLVDHCRERALPLRARLRLFAEICRGVHHAHQKGIVHRDLKSSNVLVARVGDRDAPKLIDFGVARALHDASGAGLTQTGAVVGTPAHMAPEQLASAHGDVDTRTDVYALGVLLYQLVTGVQPFATALAGARTPLEAQRLVLAAEVGRPSQERAAADCPEAAWRRQLAGDVDWIVGKATAREMARRYGSAAELADELERHLADEPVLAGPPSASYRLRKFVQRHRGRVVAAGLVLATALVGAGWTVRYALVADERARAESAAKADAEAQAARAAAASDRFAAKVRDFEQLAGVVRLQKARAAESALYPAAPAQKGALARWLADEAEPLLAMRPDLQETLATIRAMALPWTPEEQERDRAGHPQAEALAKSERRLAAVERETRLAAGEVLTIPALSPTDAARPYNELIAMARMRTGPSRFGRSIHGEEALGLAYAKAARDKNPQSLNAGWALAFALAENARDTDAVALADEILARDSGVPEDGYPVAREVRDLVAAMTSERPSRLAAARADRDALAAAVGARRTWSFAPEQAAASFLHDTLTQLVADLDAFDKLEVANARARLRWATTAYGQSRVLAHPQARMSWADVDAYLRTDARYRAAPARWSDAARLDLVPLGPNPATGLLEFYHLASAWDGVADPASLPLPEPAADGRIRVDLATGIVFVLVPGGRVTLGSQGDDPQAPFYDPERDAEETLHEVDLAPFLLARHEITQAQWHRLTSWAPTMRRPATYHEGGSVAGVNIRSTHPVERVSFVLCEQALARAGLQLPTEAQWEHACRAGTTAVRPVADHELGAFANLADTATKRVAPSFQTSPWDDGHAVHAQVGTYLPNAWGLFDMLGNVAEWCRDPDGPYGSERAGDGLRTVASPFLRRRVRGGSWLSMVSYCRSAARATAGADSLDHAIGLRASRSLQP